MTGNWEGWQPVTYAGTFKETFRWPGVYKVRLEEKNGSPVPIGRLLGIDAEGILVIGETDNISRRVTQFWNGYVYGNVHAEGQRLHEVITSCDNGEKISQRELKFDCMKLDSKSEAVSKQNELLRAYFKKYGELPPLNHKNG